MYTTPRKVKQESRLRRSLSLTNTSRQNGNTSNGNNATDEEEVDAHGIHVGHSYSNSYNNPYVYQIDELNGNRTNTPDSDLSGLTLSNTQLNRISSCAGVEIISGHNNSKSTSSSYSNGGVVVLVEQKQHNQHLRHHPTSSTSLGPDIDYETSAASASATDTLSLPQPPPYRAPPSAQGNNSGTLAFNLPDESLLPEHIQSDKSPNAYQTHSSKFPIVREVIFSEDPTSPQSSRAAIGAGVAGNSQPRVSSLKQSKNLQAKIPVFSSENSKLDKKLTTKQIAWSDERKACTLDSKTAKDFQQRLLSQQTITRRNSLDLEKFIQVFNEEQSCLMMASMQGGGRHMEGIDNPAMELGPHSTSNGHTTNGMYTNQSSNGGKMSGYSFSDSSTSQSLSLSSSNADSLDTVIYKGPTQPATSIREWQRSMDPTSERPLDFNHRNENNSFRDTGIFDGRSYQMQQAPSYQPMQFNGGAPGNLNYAIEYRAQPQQIQQNLSVQTLQPPQQHNSATNGLAANGMPRSGSSYGSNPQLTKSPMLAQKQFPATTSVGVVPTSTSPVTSSSSELMLDKTKESTKMFPTKTYNHIKDMISSRFGSAANNSSNNSASGTNGNANLNSNSKSDVRNLNNTSNSTPNGIVNSTNSSSSISNNSNGNSINSYVDASLGVPSYGHNHGHAHGMPNISHLHQHHNSVIVNPSSYSATNGNTNGNGTPGTYYVAPPNPSPNTMGATASYAGGNNNPNTNGSPMINGSASVSQNSYRSPNMSDRKNVNTSFRKAIQKSTQKSNLTEESLQLRPIMELSHNQSPSNSNRDLYRTIQYPADHQQFSPQGVAVGVHAERAQRALDKLCETAPSIPFNRTGSGPMIHSTPNQNQKQGAPGYNRMQQFGNAYGDELLRPSALATAAISGNSAYQGNQEKQQQQQQLHFQQQQGLSSMSESNGNNSHARHRFSVKPGPSSSNSNSSSGLAIVESSLSSPTYSSPKPNLKNSGSASVSMNHSQQNQQLSQKQSSVPNGNDDSQSQWSHLHPNEKPPPLPSSQKPSSGSSSDAPHNTIGLPLPSLSVLAEKRENGDGSSGTMEVTSTNMLLESSALTGKSKSDQLKQITTDLQNLAMSVAAEQALHNHLLSNHHNQSSSSECENKGSQRVGSGQSHTTTDSGHGTGLSVKSPVLSQSDPNEPLDALNQRLKFKENIGDSISSGNDSEWVDIVEPEIRQILELERASKAAGKLNSRSGVITSTNTQTTTNGASTGTNISSGNQQQQKQPSTLNSNNHTSTSSANQNQGTNEASSVLPHSASPPQSPKLPKKFDLNAFNKKASRSQEVLAGPSTSQGVIATASSSKTKTPRASASGVTRSNSGSGGQRWSSRQQQREKSSKSNGTRSKDIAGLKGTKLTRNAMNQILYALHDDNGDMTSTTMGLDLESMLDVPTENTSDDDDLSTTIDTTDAHAIRRQLESLESMYTEVLKVLGAKKFAGNRYTTSDLRNAKRRPYGSMSSLPSSVSSRPFREKKRIDDKKKVKDIKSINRRFQRLESHVVTLARSVAHLSSEMRTQHLMVQEMESIRNEMAQLRNQVLKSSMQNQSAAAAAQNFARVSSGRNGGVSFVNNTDWTSFRNALPSLTNPCRVRKLTKFFGDEPPLIRIFLKKLGYEKYATLFEQERIGIMELPYLTEERLNKMGIPMGPRLRILQEAHICLKPGHHGNHESHHSHHNNHTTGNLSVYVV